MEDFGLKDIGNNNSKDLVIEKPTEERIPEPRLGDENNPIEEVVPVVEEKEQVKDVQEITPDEIPNDVAEVPSDFQEISNEGPVLNKEVNTTNVDITDKVLRDKDGIAINSLEEVIKQEGGREVLDKEAAYYNAFSPSGQAYNNPEHAFNISMYAKRAPIDVEDKEWKDLYDKADMETKKEMVKGVNTEHSKNIYYNREIQRESQAAIANDSGYEQFKNSIIPSMADWTILATGGIAEVFGTVFKVGKAATAVSNGLRTAGAGATTGALEGAAYEAAFTAGNVRDKDYLAPVLISSAFGGSLGYLIGHLSGPNREAVANAINKKNDTFEKDFNNDPDLVVEKDENGIMKITNIQAEGYDSEKLGKNIIDRIPYIGEFLKSDVTTVFQDKSSVLRKYVSKISNPTVSNKDKNGNIVTQTRNGVDERRAADGIHNNLNKGIEDDFQKNRKTTGLSRTDYINKVSEEYTMLANEQEKLVSRNSIKKTNDYLDGLSKEERDLMTEDKIKRKYEEFEYEEYNNHKIDYNRITDENFRNSVKRYKDYYDGMLVRGIELDVKGLRHINTNKLYRPRTWDFSYIKKSGMGDDEITSILEDALSSHELQKNLSKEEINTIAVELKDNLKSGSYDIGKLTSSYLVPDKLPFENMLKQRKYKLDETKLGKLLRTNLDELTGAYHYKMKGRQAVAYAFGTDDIKVIGKQLEDDLLAEGNVFSDEAFNAFNRLVKDLHGDLRMNQLANTRGWTFTRNLTSFNSIRLGGGFGGNQFIELGSAVMISGINNIIRSGRFTKSLKNTGKLLYTKGNVDDDFTHSLINSGHLQEVLHNDRVNRLIEGETGFNSGIVENKINGMNDVMMKYNGMRYFTGLTEDLIGGGIVQQIKMLSKKSVLSTTELKRISRWGLNHNDIIEIGKDIDKHVNLREGKFQLEKFSQVNKDKFQLAISRGIEEIVIQGDSLHLPNWMKAPNAIVKLVTQFMRFPLIANEVLLRKGMSDEKARMASAVISSTVTYLGMKYVREQANLHAGLINDSDVKYDYFDDNFGEEYLMRALGESLNYNAPLGMMAGLYNYGANAIGENELGRNYSGGSILEAFAGPTFGGLLPDLHSVLKNYNTNGELNERDYMKLKSMMPFNNLPFIDEALKKLIKD